MKLKSQDLLEGQKEVKDWKNSCIKTFCSCYIKTQKQAESSK